MQAIIITQLPLNGHRHPFGGGALGSVVEMDVTISSLRPCLNGLGAFILQHLVRSLANIHRGGRPDVPCQTVVVLVRVRNDHAQQVVVGLSKTRDARKQVFVPRVRRVERQSDIKHDALSLRLDFDAGATDLLRPPMDADSHMPPCPSLFIKVHCLRSV